MKCKIFLKWQVWPNPNLKFYAIYLKSVRWEKKNTVCQRTMTQNLEQTPTNQQKWDQKVKSTMWNIKEIYKTNKNVWKVHEKMPPPHQSLEKQRYNCLTTRLATITKSDKQQVLLQEGNGLLCTAEFSAAFERGNTIATIKIKMHLPCQHIPLLHFSLRETVTCVYR